MNFEEILESVGSFGLYQKLLCFILIPLTTGLVGFTYYVQLFILNAPKFFCSQSLPGENREFSAGSDLNITELLNTNQEKLACYELTTEDILNFRNKTEADGEDFSWAPTRKCTAELTFDYDSFFPTVTSQNNWVCEESWRPYIVVTCFWIGNMIGSWLFGAMSDKFGRRPMVAVSILIYGVAGIISAFVTKHYYIFLVLRMLVGSCHHTVSHLAFVLVMEYCGVRSRVIPLLTIMMTYTIASIIAPLLAWIIWDWRTLLLVTAAPNLIIVLFYRFLPESPSWLMTSNNLTPTFEQMRRVARANGRAVDEEQLFQQLQTMTNSDSNLKNRTESDHRTGTEKDVESSLIDILKFPTLRRNIFIVLLIWMTGCLCYYGHCQNTANIGSNIFLSFVLGAAIETPAWGVPYLIEKFGRRRTLTLCFLLSGVSGGVYTFSFKHYTISFIFALLGRMFITGAYYISLQYCPEIFPTVIRGRGVAMAETFGGIAIFISPLIVYLREVRPDLPIIIFSCLSFIGGLLTVALPETRGRCLPQTFIQAELFSQRDPKQPAPSMKLEGKEEFVIQDN